VSHRVFVSRPTVLTAGQERFCDALEHTFKANGLESHTVGTQDFTNRSPLAKVLEIMNSCDGACILGLVQVKAGDVVVKPGTKARQKMTNAVFATPWNQLEAGMALIRGLPLFVVCEAGVGGGVFDDGVADAYIHRLPARDRGRWLESEAFVGSMKAWIDTMHRAIPARPPRI
jgi:hypothetical protein